jgi:hypothetical protein
MLESLLLRARAGEIRFDEVVRLTRATWKSLAQYIARRWRGPAWHGLEDLEQELILAAWYALWEYEPGNPRAPSIARYVTWNAVDKAKKARHKARAARRHRNPDAERGNFEIPFSAAPTDDVEEVWAAKASVPASQEDSCADIDAAFAACRTRAERATVRAMFETGDLLRAAAVLYDDAGSRRVLKVKTPREARAAVRRMAADVAARVEAA